MSSSKKKDPNLPEGWVLCKSKSIPGKTYYFNRKTGKSVWTQTQIDANIDNNESKKEKGKKQEKKKKEEIQKKGTKRKNDNHGHGPSKKQRPQEKQDNVKILKSPQKNEITETVTQSSSQASVSSPIKKSEGQCKRKRSKNLANTRLSNIRASLAAEVEKERNDEVSNTRLKTSPKVGASEVPQKPKEHKSPNLNDSKTNQSPNSESLQSTPSPSQFFAANKIILVMKAQLPDYNTKHKDTFADIERGICSQMPEYPTLKHPATPPQFSEATKLLSAIKSKLTYKSSTKDIPSFASANDRMEKLRADISSDNEVQRILLDKSIKSNTSVSEAMEIEEIKEVTQPIPTKKIEDPTTPSDLVLVVDTNIFIHELELIRNVSESHIKGYSDRPTLIVPWRVINELDRLKDNNNGNGPLCKRAKSAMDYLYKSLPENKHITGQSLRDSNSHIYPCEIPDDEILNCALQQAERGKSVLLISNDKNLCNKAIINNIKFISVSDLKQILEKKPESTQPEFVNNIKHYQQSIYHLLANILENEMRAKYNNLWQHVLFKAPPWTLADVLQCLLKHWIAVFNEVFPRIEYLLTDLQNHLKRIENKDQTNLTESEVSTFKDLCLDVAKRCQIIPDYMELAKQTVDRLLHSCGSDNESSLHGRTSETERVSSGFVVETFESLWAVLSSYCGELCGALGVAHALAPPARAPAPRAPAALAARWRACRDALAGLARALHGVLNAETSTVEEHIQRLEHAFNSAVSAVCGESSVSPDQLKLFCLQNKNMLQEAYTKFTELLELLNLCKYRMSSMN